MPHPLYQAAVAELETVLSPRVVSRALKEGLAQVGASPERIALDDLERILKSQVYRQLQVAMPAARAKETVSEILERLRAGSPGEPRHPTPAPTERQELALDELRAAMRPFNLYFEWPEVQKLRSQLQLLESEQESGNDVAGLLREAREQLRIVGEKLEDQLVLQARELGELEAALEQVRSLGGPKIRRLEGLLGQIRQAQASRQLATAEAERAGRLATELRKLLESNSFAPSPAGNDRSGLLDAEQDGDSLLVPPGPAENLDERLRQIDLEVERRELHSLEATHADLLDHREEMRAAVVELRIALDEGRSVQGELRQLRARLVAAEAELRDSLRRELDEIGEAVEGLRAELDPADLRQALQVARGVLERGLPSLRDMRHIRDLHALASQRFEESQRGRAQEEARRAEGLREQGVLLRRLEGTLLELEADEAGGAAFEELRDGLKALRAAHGEEALVPELAASLRRAAERLEAAAAERDGDSRQSQRVTLRALQDELEGLPWLSERPERAEAVQRRLAQLLERVDRTALGEDALVEAASLVGSLRAELRDAYLGRLDLLEAEAQALGASDAEPLIAQARQLLERRAFPEMAPLERALRAVRDRRREEELTELRTLEGEARRFEGLELSGYAELIELLDEARDELAEGRPARTLGRAWLQLETLRATVEQRLAGFEGRLDAALERLTEVEKLNSEEVAQVRRLLGHLDGQREAFERVSLGLRLELEAALEGAESTLSRLEEQLEATRAIAGRLVTGNFIDDMLGLFGAEEREAQQAEPDEPLWLPPPSAEARSDDEALNDWLDTLLAENGVSGAALFDDDQSLLAGRLAAPPADAAAGLHRWLADIARLGGELSRGEPELVTLETRRCVVVAARVGSRQLLVVLDGLPALSQVLHRLRGELPLLGALLGDSAHA